jgi:hypothetical protein
MTVGTTDGAIGLGKIRAGTGSTLHATAAIHQSDMDAGHGLLSDHVDRDTFDARYLCPETEVEQEKKNNRPHCYPIYATSSIRRVRPGWSCLMQDEPGARVCFSYKMSLEGRSGMLGIDHRHASRRRGEPGGDSGFSGGQ